ncbi:DinB family protein [Ornithinibacillus halophilus]|uniref:DinB superfamily protein n=1 Tax=Ornithinibacillus halophilus TaxID=930117 RepID=A0A1M5LYJ2_9BACI|nr:DinB family protein [Ornithinibacillus halophilus]SHG70127.1 DinB superfamily protein [Ornithinibacillus halophilus]
MELNDNVRNKLWHEVEGLSDELINQKPDEDKWSIRQILEHVYLLEKAFTKLIDRQLQNGEDVYAKDHPIEMTTDRSFKVDAPKFSVPGDEFKTLAELKEDLDNSHENLRKLVESVTSEQLLAKAISDSPFGDMNLKQSIEFVAYHELRHIEQLQEVKEAIGVVEKG